MPTLTPLEIRSRLINLEMDLRKVIIVTPVHNRSEETFQCLKSLGRAEKSGLDVHIIVVDDGSTDGTSEIIKREFPEVEILQGDGSLWYTAGTNRGIEAALRHNPEYVLAINNDSVFDENCVTYLVECAESHPNSVVGALLLNWETPHKVFQVSPKWDLWRGGVRHWHNQTVWTVPDKPWAVELIVGNCVLYPVEAIRRVGLMDEKRLVQYGDAEYTPRIRRKGWNLLIEPRARVFCKPNDTITGFRSLPLSEKLRESFFRSAGPYSLKRRLYMNLAAAPNRLQGLAALPIFYVRVLLGMNPEGKWATDQDEKTLKEVFSKSIVP